MHRSSSSSAPEHPASMAASNMRCTIAQRFTCANVRCRLGSTGPGDEAAASAGEAASIPDSRAEELWDGRSAKRDGGSSVSEERAWAEAEEEEEERSLNGWSSAKNRPVPLELVAAPGALNRMMCASTAATLGTHEPAEDGVARNTLGIALR